jgi:hypothetical protein
MPIRYVVDLYSNGSSSDLMDAIHANDAGSQKLAASFYPVLIAAIKSIQDTS